MMKNYSRLTNLLLVACIVFAGTFAFKVTPQLMSEEQRASLKEFTASVTEGFTEFTSEIAEIGESIDFKEIFTSAEAETSAAAFANEVKLVKNVNNAGGGTLLGDANLGQDLIYELQYENRDSGPINYTIIDTIPTGLTYMGDDAGGNYNAATGVLTIDLGNLAPGEQGAVNINVQVANDPAVFRDPCSSAISNQAYGVYNGLEEASYLGFADTSPAPAVFFVSSSELNFSTTEALCGTGTEISATPGFDSYTWTYNGAFVGNTETITVSQPGTYVVEKTVSCLGRNISYTETLNLYDVNGIANPILNFADDVGTCPNNGNQIPNLLLCGSEESRTLNIGFSSTASSITWKKLNSSCTAIDNCANTSSACWTTSDVVGNGDTFTVTDAGNYRVEVFFEGTGGALCQKYYYFNVYKDQLNASVSTTSYSPSALGTISIDAGGVGPQYTYSIDGPEGYSYTYGPTGENSHVFQYLIDGDYTVTVTSDSGCSYTEVVTINDNNSLWFEASLFNVKNCNRARIQVQRGGGNSPYQFAIWSINGVPRYDSFQDIPDSAFSNEESESTGGSQSRVFEFLIEEEGDYIFVVRDDLGNYAVSNVESIALDPDYRFDVQTTDVLCYGGSDGSVSLYFYSSNVKEVYTELYDADTYIYGGVNTPLYTGNASGTYPNLTAGDYIIEVTMTLKKGNSTCTFIRPFTINQPDAPLEAYAGVITDVSCLQSIGASEVKVSNASGGTPPYSYIFNGVSQASNIGYMSNDGTVTVVDANGCTYDMFVDVNSATEIPSVDYELTYNCDGTGNVSLIPSVADPDLVYLYEYSMNGDYPVTDSLFTDLPPGNYNFRLYYENATPDNPTPGLLLVEDFGTGANTTLDEINPVYDYESQVVGQDPPAGDDDANLDDGEYVVTSQLQILNGEQWFVPSDAAGEADGRYLAVNIGDVVGAGGVIYDKMITDLSSGSEITVDLSIINLLYAGSNQCDPDLIVELLDVTGQLVDSKSTGAINNDEQWHDVSLSLNSGGNSQLRFRIRSNSTCIMGNDIAIDELRVYQVPEICTAAVDVPVVVQDNEEFTGEIIAQTDLSCANMTNPDGTMTFAVYNFDTATGYEYSVNGGPWIASTASQITITDLPVGAVSIEVRNPVDDSCNFSMDASAPIGQPQELDLEYEITKQITCDATNPGASVNLTVTGGTPSYEYGVDDGSGAGITWGSNSLFTGLISGSYEFWVRDANGCETNIGTPVVLDNPENILFDLTPTVCYDGTNGEIVVDVTQGNGDYQFSLNGTAWFSPDAATPNTYIFSSLSPGSYTVYVRDGSNCQESDVAVIEPQIGLSVTSQSNIDCFGATTGDAVLTVTDFTPPYTYTVNGTGSTSQSGSTITLSNLAAGSYAVEVTDANGCIASATVVIDAPLASLDATLDVTDMTCSNPTGSVVVNTSGGYTPYEYTLTLPDNSVTGPQNNNSFNNLTQPGDYTVTITDAGGCEITRAFTLSDAVPPTLALSSAGCYDGTTMVTITATPAGGTAPFTYSINGGAFQAANTFDVDPGSYTVTVRDALDCEATENITIDEQLQISANAGTINACNGTADITATAAGGDGNYVFAIVPSGTPVTDTDFAAGNNTYTTNTAGTYDIYVRDNSGVVEYCEAMTTATITAAASLDMMAATTDVTCFAGTSGSISLTATGGTAPYEYSLDNGVTFQNSPDFFNLAAGTYNAVVRDVNGCTFALPVTITEPAELDFTTVETAYTCISDAQTTITATGGSGNYEFSLNGGAWVSNGTNIYDFTGLQDGTHTIAVRDANAISCSVDGTIIIDPLPAEPVLDYTVEYNCDGSGNITVTPLDASFTYVLYDNGGTVQATQAGNNVFTAQPAGSYTVEVEYGSGCTTTLPVVIDTGVSFTAQLQGVTHVSCNGGNDGALEFAVNNFDPAQGFSYEVVHATNGTVFSGSSLTSPVTVSNLEAGEYTIDITNTADPSCSTSITAEVLEPDAVTVTASVTVDATCDTGATLRAEAAGGTPPYTYQLEDTAGTVVGGYNFSATRDFTNIPAGDYVVRVQDANGCIADTPVSVTAPEALEFDGVEETCYAGDNNGRIILTLDPNGTGASGNGTVQFSLNGGNWENINNLPAAGQHTFDGLLPGSYTVDVRDASGCDAPQLSFTINDQLLAEVVSTDITCTDGSIDITNVTGGDGSYEYSIVPAGNSPSYSANTSLTLTAGMEGTYDISVRDASGCDYTDQVTIQLTPGVTIGAVATQPNCYNDPGSIALTINPGSAPYNIELVDGGGVTVTSLTDFTGTTHTFYNLAAGDYTINVSDNNGCTATTSETIENPEELTAIVDPIVGSCTDLNNGFGFELIGIPAYFTSGDYTIEYDDGTDTWQSSSVFDTYSAGEVVYPAVKVTHNVTGAECIWEYGRFIVPYPLDDLNINVFAVLVGCGDMTVTVEGTQGDPGYEYTYSTDPANFDPATATWTPQTPLLGPHAHDFVNLIPGRTYVFYVRDDQGCIRQSSVNVNDFVPNPDVTSTVSPSCFGSNNGEITFNVTDTAGDLGADFDWDLYDINDVLIESGTVNPFTSPDSFTTTTALSPGEYYVLINGASGCVYGSENVLVEELDPITGTPVTIRDITCDLPGLVEIQNITGGGGGYTYTLTSTNFDTNGDGVNDANDFITTSNNPIEISLNDLLDPTQASISVAVSVTDQFNCPESLGSVTLNIAQPPVINNVVVENCDAQASLTIQASGGSGTYFYSVDNGATWSSNAEFTNLAPGTYDIMVRDTNGCSVTWTTPIDIVPQLQATTAVTKAIDCSVSPDGIIDLEVLNGSGNYEYEVLQGATTVVTRQALAGTTVSIPASTAGTYDIFVYDLDTGCQLDFTETLDPAINPDFTVTAIPVNCFGGADGSLQITPVNNGAGTLTYTISPDPNSVGSQTTTIFDNLPAGTYTITATAANDCTFDVTETVTEPVQLTTPTVTVTEFACTSGNNPGVASILVTGVSGGSGNYSYEFTNTATGTVVQNGPSNELLWSDTAGGTFDIVVTDENGCTVPASATILPFVELTAIGTTPTDPTCAGGDGSIDVNVTVVPALGSTNLIYDIVQLGGPYSDTTAPVNATNHTFTGLDFGNYQITVTNEDTGCVIVTTEQLRDPETFELDITTIANVSCDGSATGIVEITIVDTNTANGDQAGVFDYTITSPNGTNIVDVSSGVTETVSNLPAGNYTITATLANDPGCTVIDTFDIQAPSEPLSAIAAGTDPSCLFNDGVIEVIAQGGWGGYGYYVSQTANPDPADAANYATTPRFENLTAGTYDVWVIDQNGCAFEVPDVTLTDPSLIDGVITATNPNCDGLSGEITVNGVTGGAGSDYTFQLIRDGADFGAPQYGSTALFTGLGAGVYEVRISDALSCETTLPASIELFEEFTVSGNIDTDLSCDATNAAAGGVITLTTTGGSGDFTYDAVYPDGTPDSNATGTFGSLTLVGTYQFTVTDNITGCVEVIDIELTAPVIPAIDSIVTTNETCNGADGTITVELDPATETDPPYTYELSQGATVLQTNTSGSFTGLAAGTYDITVTSALGCFVTDTAVIGTDPTPEIALEVTDNCDPSGLYEITVNMTQEGVAPYTLSVNGSVRNINIDSSTPYVITGLTAGSYDIVLTDANGCGVNATGIIDIVPLDFNVQVSSLLYCDGPAEITISGITGAGPFEYSISGPGTSDLAQTALNPAGETWNGADVAGTYVVTVYDLNGTCSLTKEVIVPERVEPTINVVSLNDPNCDGDMGQIIVSSPDNGIGPFTFEIVQIDGAAASVTPDQEDGYTATFSNLAGSTAGITYTIRATAQNGCEVETAETITSPEPVNMPVPTVTHFSCNAGSNSYNNALVVVDPSTITGGSGNYVRYEFTFNGVTQVSANPEFIVTDTMGGTGTVTVYDDNNCSTTRSFIIDPFIGIENPQLVAGTPATCLVGEDITVSVDVFEGVSGNPGTTDLLFTLTDINGNPLDNSGTITATGTASHTFNDLAPGAYFINILNEYTGCEVSLSHTVDDPDTFVMTATMADPACYGLSNGSVTLTMIDTFLGDGNQAGSFDWTITGITDPSFTLSGTSNGLTTITIPNIPAGHYEVNATITSNSLGCDVDPTEFTITEPLEDLTATIEEVHNVTCTNDRGEIYVDVSGGYPYYEITLVKADGTYSETHTNVDGYVFLNLSAGIYTAYITDQQGCTYETEPLELIRPEFISAEITGQPTTCFGSNTGEVSAINVTGGAGPDSYFFELYDQSGNMIGESQEEPTFTDLAAGFYFIRVRDPWDCDFDTEVFEVQEPEEITITMTDQPSVVCYGTTDGYYEFNMTGGTAPYTVELYHPDSDTPVDTQTGIGVAEAVTFWDLEGDVDYRIVVTDANTCTNETTFMIPTGPDLSSAVNVVYECSTNLPENYIEVTLTNTSLPIDQVLYALNSQDINQAVLFNEIIDGKGIVRNVPAGADQYITIFHEGCAQVMPAEEFFEVIDYQPLELSLANEQLNVIDFNATGGNPPYTYYVNGEYRGDDADYRIRETGTYEVVVVDDNGCEARAEIFVEFYDIEIPNFFTPDGDSNNDVWGPGNSEAYPSILTRVYDRYGRVVGKMRVGQFWDGTYNGAPLPSGDYWYVIKFDEEEDAREFVGHFTLYR